MSRMGYINELRPDGLMISLGFEALQWDKKSDFRLFLNHCKQAGFVLLGVSEAIYRKEKKVIDGFNQDFECTIIVLSNTFEHGSSGRERLSLLLEEAIGIKL